MSPQKLIGLDLEIAALRRRILAGTADPGILAQILTLNEQRDEIVRKLEKAKTQKLDCSH